MIGSFLTRGLVMVLGYAYPAYECYKTVEKNKPEIEQLRFWCQYWILVAFLTVCERVGDAFVSWVPMYSEVKLLFFVYLWHPKMMGTTYVYDSFFRPYLSKHENEIDRNLLELRTRAGDIVILYWQRVASYSQTRIFEILQYVASQSTPRTRPAQGARARQPPPAPNRQSSAASNRQPASATQSQPEEPPSPTSSTTSSQFQKEIAEELASPKVLKAATKEASATKETSFKAATKETSSDTLNQVAGSIPKATAAAEKSNQATSAETEEMQIEAVPSTSETETANPPPKDTVMEESIRVTRGRLRKTRSAVNR